MSYLLQEYLRSPLNKHVNLESNFSVVEKLPWLTNRIRNCSTLLNIVYGS